MFFLTDYSFDAYGYTFLLQDMHAKYNDASISDYPNWFWMMFYSEEQCTIGFLGYYCQQGKQKVRPYEDFSSFLKEEFDCFEW